MSFESEETQKDTSGITILAFHKLLNLFSFGSTNYSPRRFEKLLKYFQKQGRGYDFFDSLTDTDNKKIAITFDDGYKHLLKPLKLFIDKYQIKPTIFIPTAFIGRSNNWDYSHIFKDDPHLDKSEIKELALTGVKFGSHGHTHTAFTKLTPEQLDDELILSKKILEDLTGREVESISYPFGRYNRQILEKVSYAGYKFAVTMNFPTSQDSPLTLGRYPIYFYDNIFSINQKITGGKLYRIEQAKAKFTHKLAGGSILLNRLKKK